MNEELDLKSKKMLMNAMARMKEDAAKQRKKQEDRLWQEISLPCGLAEALAPLNKMELDKIRIRLNLPNISTLRKAELTKELIRRIPEHAGKVFGSFDEEQYLLVKQICENGGFTYVDGMPINKVEHLREWGIVFPGSRGGRKVMILPLELVHIFRETDDAVYQKTVKQNTEWIRLTQGLLYYYGVVGYYRLQKLVEKLTGEELDTHRFVKVLNEAAAYYGQIKAARDGFSHHQVQDEKNIIREQQTRPAIDYYSFTREELFRAGEPGFIDRTPAWDRLTGYLLDNFKMTGAEAEALAVQSMFAIKSGEKINNIIQHLLSTLKFPSMKMVQEFISEVMNFYHHTRVWVLKGHTPDEIFQEEKKHLKPLPAEPFGIKKNTSKVIDIRSKVKVGRNDPCPCGSGKKYKKCCGKNIN